MNEEDFEIGIKIIYLYKNIFIYIEYLHCMIEGSFKINQELNKIILNSERVFTNQ